MSAGPSVAQQLPAVDGPSNVARDVPESSGGYANAPAEARTSRSASPAVGQGTPRADIRIAVAHVIRKPSKELSGAPPLAPPSPAVVVSQSDTSQVHRSTQNEADCLFSS